MICWIIIAQRASAGPPFTTDDPEPVEYRHWEIYVASQIEHDKDNWSGTSPHFEVNYGALPNLQLHLIAPVAFSAAAHGATNFGYGDTEVGVKYRFFEETDQLPQVGVFPLVEIPSGNRERSLGSGHAQVFLPLWLQKSFGPWTTYGGGGYWINPGKDNHDWWFTGWLLQREITSELTLGGEIFHETSSEKGGDSDTRLNFGGFYNFSDTYHFLFSAGHTVQGPSTFQAYVAFQITFGPEKESQPGKN
ncbi:MAG: transporter [Candidatus Binatia bacterium]